MKFIVNLERDSANSYLGGEVVIEDWGEEIIITIPDPEREIVIKKEDLKRVLG